MLERLYQCYLTGVKDESIPKTHFTQSECQAALKAAKSDLQPLLREYQALRMDKHSSTSALEKAKEDLHQQEGYVDFICFYEKTLQLPMALNEAFIRCSLHEHKAMSEQFKDDFEAFLTLTTSDLQYQVKPVFRSLAVKMTSIWLMNLENKLADERSPSALLSILPELIDDIPQFSASLLWLLKKGVGVDAILCSGILHKYASCYLPCMADKAFNEIALLYSILRAFPESLPLCEAAKTVSWDIRGKVKRSNLLGETTSSDLRLLEISQTTPAFTRTAPHLSRLFSLYEDLFLKVSVRQLFLNHDDEVDRLIQREMRRFLPRISTLFLDMEIEDLKLMAPMISDEAFEEALEAGNHTVLLLLPFKKAWIEKISDLHLESLIHLINAHVAHSHEIEKVKLLLAFHEALLANKRLGTEALLHSVILCLSKHPYLLEDEYVFRSVKRAHHLKSVIESHVNRQCIELKQSIAELLSDGLTSQLYVEIKKSWRHTLDELDYCFTFNQSRHPFPESEEALAALIFQTLQNQSVFTPDESQWSLWIEAMQLDDRAAEFKRSMLLHILVSLDIPALRASLIEALSLTPEQLMQEMRPVYFDAIALGNRGLIFWGLEGHAFDDEILEQAMRTKQWWLIEKHLDKAGIWGQVLSDKLLVELVRFGQVDILKQCLKSPLPYTQTGVSGAFIEAAIRDDAQSLKRLLHQRPALTAVKAALNQAVTLDSQNAIQFFQRIPYHPSLIIEIEKHLSQAVKKGNAWMVKALLGFSNNQLSHALLKKIKLRHERKEGLESVIDHLAGVLKNPGAKAKSAFVRSSLPSRPSTSSCASIDSYPDVMFFSPLLRRATEEPWARTNNSKK